MSNKNRTTAAADQAPADPQAGGCYLRNPDGSLVTVHQTAPAVGRAQRAQAQDLVADTAGSGTTPTTSQE